MRRLFALVLAASCLCGATPQPSVTTKAQAPAGNQPVAFMAPCIDVLLDLHGDPASADLVLFVGGNEWFAMPAIVQAFEQTHPEVSHVYYETLPPGILSAQLHQGGLSIGDLLISAKPDVLISSNRGIATERSAGLVGEPVTFASNILGIMVRDGNPKHVLSLADLGRDDVRVAMPNPKTEGVARQIEAAYRKAGGDALDRKIMQEKVAAGTTILTSIHHRETPMWILSGKADAGPVWMTEAQYQARIKSGLSGVVIPKEFNARGLYVAATVNAAPHPAAAAAFVQFLASPQAQAIYRSYGFDAATAVEE